VLRKLVRHLGIPTTAVLVTVAAVIFSVCLSATIDWLLHGDISSQAVVFAIAVPLMISPVFSIVFLRLVFQLEDLQAQLRETMQRDELTRAFNRRHWIEAAEMEIARAKRHRDVFSIVLLDIDDFKRVNDTYGHQAGDTVLREVSRICVSQSRSIDTFARYGGEEFIFLLPHSDRTAAWACSQRVRKTLEEATFSFGQIPIRITVSIGVITFDPAGPGLEDMFKQVDEALYAA
jgi:diguanylate cyclase (GGDEF)-like protein